MAKHNVDMIIRARDEATRNLSRVSRSTAVLGQTFRSLISLAGTYIGVRSIARVLEYGATFEKTMSRVAVLSRSTMEEEKLLTETAKELGKTTVFSASQASEAMSYLALAGFEVNQIVAAMPSVLNLAASGQVDLAEAADITAKVMRGMGLSTGELTKAVDVLTMAMTTANTNLTQLGEAMQYVGPIGRAAGMSMEELTSAIQVLSNAGIQASMAGTSMRMIIGVLAGSTPEATAQLNKMGIATKSASGVMRPLSDILDDMNRSMRDLGQAEKTAAILQLFGQRAGPGMAALLAEGGQTLRDFEKQLTDSTGSAARISEKQLNNVAGSWTKLKSVIGGITLDITSQTDGFLKDYIDAFTGGLQTFWGIVKNWRTAFDLFATGLELGSLTAYEAVKYFFVEKIPATFKWFIGNVWTFAKMIGTAMENIALNIKEAYMALYRWGHGEGWSFSAVPLLEGWEAAWKKFPEIAERELTNTEKTLAERYRSLLRKLSAAIVQESSPAYYPYRSVAPLSPRPLPEENPLLSAIPRIPGRGDLTREFRTTSVIPGSWISPADRAAIQTERLMRDNNRQLKRLADAYDRAARYREEVTVRRLR